MKFLFPTMIALSALALVTVGWFQPGTSLCFIGQRDVVSQIQFSPRYWHRNDMSYAGIETVDMVAHPLRPGEQTVRIRGGHMELVYGFIDQSWVNDVARFQQQIADVTQQKRRFTCRFRDSVWLITAGLLLLLTALGLFSRNLFRRPQS